MDPKSSRMLLESARTAMGIPEFKRITTEMNREQVSPDREDRKKYTDRDKARKWDEQKVEDAVCNCQICRQPLPFKMKMGKQDFRGIEMHHIDPQEQDFGAWDNLALTHDLCNREVGSKSLLQRSKEEGETIEYLRRLKV